MARGRFGNVTAKWNQSLLQSHVRENLTFDEADYPNSALLLDGGYGSLYASNRSHVCVSGASIGRAGPWRAGFLGRGGFVELHPAVALTTAILVVAHLLLNRRVAYSSIRAAVSS